MVRWLRSLFRRADPVAEFLTHRNQLLAHWFGTAVTSGKPKWLTWLRYEVLGDPLFRDAIALVPVQVWFEPIPDAPLEDVPQARDPRAVVAVFTYRRGWTTDGRAVFNLTPQQLAERMKPRSS